MTMNIEMTSNQQVANRRDRYVRTRIREIAPEIEHIRKEAMSLKEDKTQKGATYRQYLMDRIKALTEERKTLLENSRAMKAARRQ